LKYKSGLFFQTKLPFLDGEWTPTLINILEYSVRAEIQKTSSLQGSLKIKVDPYLFKAQASTACLVYIVSTVIGAAKKTFKRLC
jgi:hypothetical protein